MDPAGTIRRKATENNRLAVRNHAEIASRVANGNTTEERKQT